MCGVSQHLLDKRLWSEGLRPAPPRPPVSFCPALAREDGPSQEARERDTSWVLAPCFHREALGGSRIHSPITFVSPALLRAFICKSGSLFLCS